MSTAHVARVVVTGASGFIGGHLVRRAKRAGLPVLAIVRTLPAESSRAPRVQYVARDLERVESLADVLQADDVVVHLAARVHVMHEDPAAHAAYRAANVEPLRMLCRAAAERGVRRVIYLSSAKVFGEGREQPYTRADPLRPAEAYAQSKVEAEQVLRDAGSAAGFEWTILRPPFVYGPGGKGNFPRLVSLARLSRRVPLPLASIENRRSIVFVGNLVDLILRSAQSDAARNQVLLPTDARDVSTPELLRAICAATSSRARLFSCPPSMLRAAASLIGRSAEMDRLTESLRLDARHLHEELDWKPPYSLEAALARSVAVVSSTSTGPFDD